MATVEAGGQTPMSHFTSAMSDMLFSVVNENITQIVHDVRSRLGAAGTGGRASARCSCRWTAASAR